MKVFAIGDLHLSFNDQVDTDNWDSVTEYKSMCIFGEKWNQHYRKIYENWTRIVSNDDIVLLPGDISWATTIDEIGPDIKFIDMLPGKKVFVRGNHDYWWQGISKMRSIFPDDFYLLQNDSREFGEIVIAGSRGWIVPNSYQFTEHDEKIFNRELIRLELSLNSIKNNHDANDKVNNANSKLHIGQKDKTRIVMLHYMPVNEKHEHNAVIELLTRHNVDICVYGHLHGEEAHHKRLEGKKWGIEFRLVSSDFLDFRPELILY